MAWSVEEMVTEGRLVLHRETGVIGQAVELFDGVAKKHVGLDGEPVEVPVLRLSSGDTFVVRPDAFTPLTEKEVVVFQGLVTMLTNAVAISLRTLRAIPLDLPTSMIIVAAALRQVHKAAIEMIGKGRTSDGGGQDASGGDGPDAGGDA